MELELTASAPLPEAAVTALRQLLMDQYQLRQLRLHFRTPRPAEDKSDILMGREIKGKPVPIDGLNPKMGAVVVEGKVFAAECYETRKPGVWRLTFDMTDYRNSVTVTKYMEGKEAQSMQNAVSPGMWLRVQGNVELSRDGKDIQLRPFHIMKIPHKPREDTAPEKRVELHLHTKMSNMDALTDTASVIKQAIAWGHPAIAITDHGVAQSFPDAWHTAKGKIKILYGVEGYFINNLDDRIAVHGPQDQDFSDEIVCFDIETTGLKVDREAITEIGAVVLKDGQVTDRFQTFVNPGRRLTPEIIGLTGITDAMLSGAPSPKEALTAFLSFVNGRPLAAHNAEFDISFIRAGCRREGIPFDPTYVDSLILAQNLLPELHKFKLDIVAEYLDLPAFNHHRASDDAAMVAYMLIPFFQKMEKELGIRRLQQINPQMLKLRPRGSKSSRFPKHIILLAKNKMGLKHLYQLISASNLQYFKRVPIIPKTELMAHREGLIVGSACEAGGAVPGGEGPQGLGRAQAHRIVLRLSGNSAHLQQYVHAPQRRRPVGGGAAGVQPHHRPPGPGAEQARLRHRRRPLPGAGGRGLPPYPSGQQEVPRCRRASAHLLQDHHRDAGGVLLSGGGAGPPGGHRQPPPHRRPGGGDRAAASGPAVPAPPGKLPGGPEPPGVGQVSRPVRRPAPQLVVDRLNVELGSILGKYDVVYMSAQKLVQRSLENGYLVGSRGSVGSSLVAYMSGITEVNSLPPHYRCPQCRHVEFITDGSYGCGADMPDKDCPECGTKYVKDGFDIPFETFLGYGGGKVPDIDLNFSGEYQARAHRHAIEMFGQTQVFRAGTIGTLAEKTAFGFVRKYLDERGLTAGNAEVNRLTQGCVGVRRTTGQHPGGLVVVPDDMDVEDFTAVQHPADAEDADTITTHFEYHCMEDNLLKLDMLGHDDPTMIRMLEDLTGVNARTIPLDDPDTMSIFTSSRVLGFENDELLGPTGAVAIPEFNTRFTRGMLVDTQPKDFNTLVRLSGFSHGTDVWLGNARDLIVSGTASVLETVGCRDDIMLYLIHMGLDPKMSFKIMEAVRKGKVKKGGFQDGWEDAMRAHQVPEWYIESLAKIGYLFPKAHAVAYVMMAFRIAWFKVHRPLAFYATFFTVRAKAFDAEYCCAGIDAVKRKIREIENNKDATAVEQNLMVTLEVCYEFYLRGFHFDTISIYESQATAFKITDNGLLPPFISVRGLGETAAQDTVEKRKGKTFISVEEFSTCCSKLSKTHIEQLKALGAFAGMADTSQITLFG